MSDIAAQSHYHVCDMNPCWAQLASRANVELSADQHDSMARFIELLLEANRTLNLTRIVDPAAAEIHHVADALTLLPHIPATTATLVDVGSGGGVPGIPLAIALPKVQFTLIESTRKKCVFLTETAQKLRLANIRVLDRRAEEAARTPLRELSDVVVARAVGSLSWLAEWCLPLARVGGKVLAMKGARAEEEIAEAVGILKLLGGGAPIVHKVELPGTDHHVIVEIPKSARTLAKFPRDATATGGKPLTPR